MDWLARHWAIPGGELATAIRRIIYEEARRRAEQERKNDGKSG